MAKIHCAPITFIAMAIIAIAAPGLVNAEIDLTKKTHAWVSFAANFDCGRHDTQFFEPHHNAIVETLDSRIEFWLPPYRDTFSYGPYIRLAGINANKPPDWENTLVSAPGFGLQIYPFSFKALRGKDNWLRFLGPLRLFGEYNFQEHKGIENAWRPRRQTKAGAEYWLAKHIHEIDSWWWTEVWAGAWWQSANDFDRHYNASFFAINIKGGGRIPRSGFLSWITPYAVVDSSSSSKPTSYWENRLALGGGLRLAPKLDTSDAFLTRFVVYAECLHISSYYRTHAPNGTPQTDWRVGVSFSLGKWFQEPK